MVSDGKFSPLTIIYQLYESLYKDNSYLFVYLADDSLF